MTIYEIMKYCKNFFPDKNGGRYKTWTVKDGTADLSDFVAENQLYLIEGSKFNDGIHRNPTETLRDETFTGCITPLCPPADFLELCQKIIAWDEESAQQKGGLFSSEHFGDYSYSRLMIDGRPAGWQDIWGKELRQWRRV